MAQTLGIIDLTWRGQRLAIEKGAKLKLGGVKNTVVVTGKQVHRAEEFEASEVTATIPLLRGQSLLALFGTGEGALSALCDTGQTYSWPDAFLTNRPEATGGEGGKVELTWAAGAPEELI
jgi:hypothetical protein